MYCCPDDSVGLRARKKLATRLEISLAASGLALVHGPENVRVDDIAATAGVSPRTYNNYFSCREEAICGVQIDQARRVVTALRARPAGEPLPEAITAALLGNYAEREPDRDVILLIIGHPVLRGEFFKALVMLEWPLAEAIAERTGTEPGVDLFPGVLATAVAGTIRVAVLRWAGADSGRFGDVLAEALALAIPIARAHERPPSPKST